MYFGEVDTKDAAGCYLAHSLNLSDGRLRKGTLLESSHLNRLVNSQINTITVARLDPGEVHEDDAARQLANALCGTGLRCGRTSTGRVNLHATTSGLFCQSQQVVLACNAVCDSITLATLPPDRWVEKGRLVATVKIIPYAVSDKHLQNVLDACQTKNKNTALCLKAPRPARAHLIQSRLDGTSERLLQKTAQITRTRLLMRQVTLVSESICEHTNASMGDAIQSLIDNEHCQADDWLIISGASAISDIADVVPGALHDKGAHIIRLGIPVDPGNLLMLAKLGTHTVLGMPGCARSPKYNGFDLFIDRLACQLPLDKNWIDSLSVGGLITEILDRPQPRIKTKATTNAVSNKQDSSVATLPPEDQATDLTIDLTTQLPTKSVHQTDDSEQLVDSPENCVAVLLAAGSSQRYGKDNKLLADWKGAPLIVATLKNLLNSAVHELLLITGADADGIEDVLVEHFTTATTGRGRYVCDDSGKVITTIHNPLYASGMASSLKIAVAELLEREDVTLNNEIPSALICLADMPMIQSTTIDQILRQSAINSLSSEHASAFMPIFNGQHGHPVLLRPELFDLILDIQGDTGARILLKTHADQVCEIPVNDPGILRDIDTPGQLATAIAAQMADKNSDQSIDQTSPHNATPTANPDEHQQ